jgi:hypothetical protein
VRILQAHSSCEVCGSSFKKVSKTWQLVHRKRGMSGTVFDPFDALYFRNSIQEGQQQDASTWLLTIYCVTGTAQLWIMKVARDDGTIVGRFMNFKEDRLHHEEGDVEYA